MTTKNIEMPLIKCSLYIVNAWKDAYRVDRSD